MMKQDQKQNTQSPTDDSWLSAVQDAALTTALGNAHASHKNTDIHAHIRRATRLLKGGFALEVDIEGMILELNIPGLISRYQVVPVVTALEVAAGMAATKRSLLQIVQRLQKFTVPEGYLSARNLKNGALVIDDTAASTPKSMLAGLKTLSALAEHRRIAIVENLSAAVAPHAPLYTDILIVIGKSDMNIRQLLQSASSSTDTHYFETHTEAEKWVKKYLKSNDTVLVSGSKRFLAIIP